MNQTVFSVFYVYNSKEYVLHKFCGNFRSLTAAEFYCNEISKAFNNLPLENMEKRNVTVHHSSPDFEITEEGEHIFIHENNVMKL
jgi:hypothetical protein